MSKSVHIASASDFVYNGSKATGSSALLHLASHFHERASEPNARLRHGLELAVLTVLHTKHKSEYSALRINDIPAAVRF